MLIGDRGYALIMVMFILVFVGISSSAMMLLAADNFCIMINYENDIKDYYIVEGVKNMVGKNLKTKIGKLIKRGYIDKKDLIKEEILLNKDLEINYHEETLKVDYKIISIEDESAKVNINNVSEKVLDALPGIGIQIADNILEERAEEEFLTIEGIKRVEGVGEENYKVIKEYITVNTDGRINVNTAPKVVLKSLEGVGEVIAERITESEIFTVKEELKRVKGIGDSTYNKLEEKIKVDSNNFKARIKVNIEKHRFERELEIFVCLENKEIEK